MTIYDTFAIIAFLTGVGSGIYLLGKAKKYFILDKNAGLILALWGLTNIYIGCVYLVSLWQFQSMTLTIGVYLRPAMSFVLSLPVLFFERMRL
jgi:hypothetical protein